MKPEVTSLFTSIREFLFFLLLMLSLFLLSLSYEYINYKDLTRFNDAIIEATVLTQYTKHKEERTYQVLKLQLKKGPSFYTIADEELRNLSGYKVSLWMKTDRISFLEYLRGFFTYSRIEHVERTSLLRYGLSNSIAAVHKNHAIKEIYGALFTATPMSKEVRVTLSALGISHLLAISGFHLGVLSFLLFGLLRLPYAWLQERYFPFRHGKRDLFIIVAVVLAVYVIFLGMPPSLLRSFTMLLIGYVLYDRGVKVVSMQTLLLTVLLLIALWPTLFFKIGFWLSVSGVFYIFLFLIHFSGWSRWIQFVGLHVWVYAMMLPMALVIFGTFSLWHPFSILATMVFTLFYPLVLLLHFIGLGALLDPALSILFEGSVLSVKVNIHESLLFVHIFFSLLSLLYQKVIWIVLVLSMLSLISAVYQIA